MARQTYRRAAFDELVRRVTEPRPLIQVLAGPRQVGKSTLAQQIEEAVPLKTRYANADDPAGRDGAWLRSEWEAARLATRGRRAGGLLILDEIHKVPEWSDLVKLLWDEDTRNDSGLRVMLLGSSQLLMDRGLGESLTGRFEMTRLGHWSFSEMRQAFGWRDVDRFIFYGGYPGAARFADDFSRWRDFIQSAMIETTLSRDILLVERINKPALLRQLFMLACDYSGQELSYRKMVGQLDDAGNTVTLARYLELLDGTGLVTGLSKFSEKPVIRRASSPKLLVMNTALMSAVRGLSLDRARDDKSAWGRTVESAVGAHLLTVAHEPGVDLTYWRDGGLEVDFVLRRGDRIAAIEVTSAIKKRALRGLDAFMDRFGHTYDIKPFLVGGRGLPHEEFLQTSSGDLLGGSS